MRHADPLVAGVVVLVAAIAAAVLFLLDAVRSSASKQNSVDNAKIMKDEAESFFAELECKALPPVQTAIVLREGESALLQEPSILYESRSYRVFGGGGTRIGGIYVGGGASEAQQRLKQVDTGTIVLTTQRLVFDGQMESRVVNLKDVVSAKPWSDAVEVNSSRRQKSQLYTVANSIIWTQMIRRLADGSFSPPTKIADAQVDRSDMLAGGEKQCPGCGEHLMKEAVRCRFCGHDFRLRAV